MDLETTSRTHRTPRREPTGLVAWLKVLDATLKLIEASVWEIRSAAEETITWAREDWVRLLAELGLFRAQASNQQDRLVRMASAGLTLGRIAGSYRLHLTKAAFLTRARAARSLEKLHAVNARRFRELCEAQGGGFLKVGQILSTRRDILPDVFVDELVSLQDQAPKMPFAIVESAIERELGGSLDELFAHFDDVPCAAASIGQVHRARLGDGREVAVKVRRPNIESILALDLDLMAFFLDAMEDTLPPVDLETIKREIKQSLMQEIDFSLEAERTESLGALLHKTSGVRAPRVIAERSSAGVLTTEWVEGKKLTSALDEADDATRVRLFESLIQSLARQILVEGAFHADPHPGNILVDEGGAIVFIDFGCVGSVSQGSRKEYMRLMQAFMANDRETVSAALLALGFETQSGSPTTLLTFADALLGMLRSPEKLASIQSADDIAAEIQLLLAAATDDPVVKLPGDFIMIARVFGTLGGFVMHYKPEIEPTRCLFPVLAEAMVA
jgi:ubiquinone biosynthesis protein